MKVQQVQQVQQPVFQFCKRFLDKLLCSNYFGGYYTTTLLHYYTNHSFYSVFYSVIWTSKNNPYYWSHILRFVRHRVTAPSFSVRKYVYFVHTILTVYLTILHSFLSVSSRRCGACAAPSAEHARPQASMYLQIVIRLY